MSKSVSISMQFPDWEALLGSKMTEISLLIAATMQTNRAMMFDNSNAGRSTWAPPKLRKGQPLSQRGPLRQSFSPQNDGKIPGRHPDGIVRFNDNVVTIGTNVKYAAILNTGGVIHPKKPRGWLWIPLPDGKPKSSNAPSEETKSLKKRSKKRAVWDGDEYVEKTIKKNPSGWIWNKLENGPIIVTAPSGKVFLLARQVTIPARPMDQWNHDDQEELETTLSNKLAEIFNG